MQEHPHLGHSANESDPHILVHKLDEHEHNHEHGHDEPGHKGHGHEHGRIETDLYNNRTGLRAVQISTAGMLLVALVQLLIAFSGGSAGLFADALHNLGDVLTTVALWIAFVVSNRAANRQYTYGYYRAEDLAGIFIVLVIIASAVAGAVESILKLTSGNVPTQIYLSMVAAAIGCIGNEVLAQYKINVGQRINSVALVADGQHSRIDAVDPHVVPTIVETASAVDGVEATTQVKARWIGRTLHISMNIEVNAALTLLQAHEIAEHVRHSLFHEIAGVSEVVIHTDPSSASGDMHQETAHHIQAAQRPIVER